MSSFLKPPLPALPDSESRVPSSGSAPDIIPSLRYKPHRSSKAHWASPHQTRPRGGASHPAVPDQTVESVKVETVLFKSLYS